MNTHQTAGGSEIALTSSTTATVENNTITTEPAHTNAAPESTTTTNADFDGAIKQLASGSKLGPIPEQPPEKKPLAGLWQNFVKVAPTNFVHKSLANWSVNPVVGCGHGCSFCYVPSVSVNKQAQKLLLLGVEDPDADWGLYAFIRGWSETEFRKSVKAANETALEKLAGDGHRAVMFSTTTDPYQVVRHVDPKEGKRLTEELQRIVRRALEIIRDESTLRVRILTRSPLAREDFALFKSFGDRLVFGMSLPTLNDRLARVYEPKAPSPTQRLKTLRAAKAADLNVYVAIAPTYPECDEADILATLKAVAELNPVTIYHEPINMRAENVARIQAQADKEGVVLKTEVFATREAWAAYSLEQLYLIERLANQVGIYDRLHLWPDPDLAKAKFVAAQPDPKAFSEWLAGWWGRIAEWPGVNGGKAGRMPATKTAKTAADKSAKKPASAAKETESSVTTPKAPDLKVKLSVRTPDEILAMEFDPNDRYLENGVFAKGQPVVILGPGGLGKSRLLLQLAACTILGREFVGMKVRSTGLKWLIIQGENSNHRLQADLKALKEWLGPDDWKLVQANLHLHTLETLDDSHLSLGDKTVASQLAALVKEIQPDVIAIDPLASFAVGQPEQ